MKQGRWWKCKLVCNQLLWRLHWLPFLLSRRRQTSLLLKSAYMVNDNSNNNNYNNQQEQQCHHDTVMVAVVVTARIHFIYLIYYDERKNIFFVKEKEKSHFTSFRARAWHHRITLQIIFFSLVLLLRCLLIWRNSTVATPKKIYHTKNQWVVISGFFFAFSICWSTRIRF